MKEHLETLQSAIDEGNTEIKTLLAQRETEAAEQRAATDAALEKLGDRIAALEEAKKGVETYEMPGIKYGSAEKDFADGVSLARCIQLMLNPSLSRKKEYGVEVEMFKQQRDAVDALTPFQRKALNIGADSDGGFFVPHEVAYNAIIQPLQDEVIAMALGASQRSGLVGTLDYIVNEGGAEAFHVDLESEERVDASQDSFEILRGVPHTMASRVVLTHGMMNQTAVNVEAMVQQRMTQRFARRMDKTAFVGIGASSEPRGVLKVAGVNDIDWLDTSLNPAGANQNVTDRLDDMVFAPRKANYSALGGARAGWAGETLALEYLNSAKDADGRKLLAETNNAGPLSAIYGAPVRTTEALNSGDATKVNWVYSADWREMEFLNWGVLELRVGTEGEDMSRGRTTVVGFMKYDVIIKQAKAFVKSTDFNTNSAGA
jgi:HK97 family phage major capsid protein